jgi:alkylation response protein AidB-like acyl-CoA dehydrogenase
VELGDSAIKGEYRREARTFIEEYAPDIRVRGGHRAPASEEIPLLREWTARMFAADYIGYDWPEQFGGKVVVDPLRAEVFFEEVHKMGAAAPIGAAYLVPGALLDFGSDAQQARYLPEIRSGREFWCQLFSEPDAGSDLASLRTRADRCDGGFLVTGQKVWNTNAHVADFGYLLARTDWEVPKHAGITAFAINMQAAGVTVRPLREITGTADFNEVFLDSVFLPADSVIGEPGGGWRVAVSSLGHERQANRGLSIHLQARMDDLIDLSRRLQRDGQPLCSYSDVRQKLARLCVEVEVATALQYVGPSHVAEEHYDVADAPITKVYSSEVNVRLVDAAFDLMGDASILVGSDRDVIDGGTWQDDLLYARTYTIAGGSNEILRNMIAERGLGLPRDRSK